MRISKQLIRNNAFGWRGDTVPDTTARDLARATTRSESNISDVAVLACLHVDAVDEANTMRVRLHHQRRRANAVAEEADTLHDRAIGHAGRGEDDVLARGQILRAVDPLDV